MQPLRVSARIATKLSVSDDWSPSLDALLIKLLLDELGLASSNPTPEDVATNQRVIDEAMPIAKGTMQGEWYWQTSSPCYLYEGETIERIHKRWDQQDRNLDWKGKRRNWSTSETNTKSWTILLLERSTPRIDWYCVGDADEVLRLLQNCSGLAKKRRSQVVSWEVERMPEDWHLWKDGALMRPIPVDLIKKAPSSFSIREWAWRPPTHIPENFAKCVMPLGLAQKVEALYGTA
jgi:hypothetical protein